MSYPGFRFETGDAVEIDGVLYEILSRSKDGVDLNGVGSRLRRWLPNEEFWTLYHEKIPGGDKRRLTVRRGLLGALPNAVRASLDRPLDDFAVRWQDEALMRLDYVETCDRIFSLPKSRRRGRYPKRPEGYDRIARLVAFLRRRRAANAASKRSCQIGLEVVSGSTVREWHRRWVNSGRDMRAILPCHDSKGAFGERLDGAVIEIVGRWIRELYLTLERPDAKPVYDCVVHEIAQENLSLVNKLAAPSYRTFVRCIERWTTPYDLVLKREGAKAAEQLGRHVRRAPQATMPLQVVEIDHTPLDILLIDEAGNLESGDRRNTKNVHRVWLTLARCQATKMIFGWHISPERPSWTSVMATLKMGIQRKSLEGLRVNSPYPVFGVPTVLKMDNGTEFHSRSLRAAAGQLRMELRYMPRGKPHLKGGIERTLGVIARDFLAFLPGRTFSNPQVRGDYPSGKFAAVTLPKVNELFAIYVIDIMHNKPMGALLGRTPLQVWESLSGFDVRMPPNADELDAILALTIDRTVTSVGVTFLGLVYQSAELQGIRKRVGLMGKLLMVKVDPYDLGSVLVLDEGVPGDNGRKAKWISVPCNYPELADGVSVVEWKDIVHAARNRTSEGNRVSLATLRQARALLAEEGRRLGVGPRKVQVADIDYAQAHADDPFFDVSPDDSNVDGPLSQRRGRGRPRKSVTGSPDRKVGDGGHAPGGDIPIDDGRAMPDAAEDNESDSGVEDDAKSALDDGQASDVDSASSDHAVKPVVNYDDPDTWDD
jgi:putative transposase